MGEEDRGRGRGEEEEGEEGERVDRRAKASSRWEGEE